MASNSPTPELSADAGTPKPVTVSFGQRCLNEVIRLGVCAVSRGGLSVVLLMLAVLTILTPGGQPHPTPNPNPSLLF